MTVAYHCRLYNRGKKECTCFRVKERNGKGKRRSTYTMCVCQIGPHYKLSLKHGYIEGFRVYALVLDRLSSSVSTTVNQSSGGKFKRAEMDLKLNRLHAESGLDKS